VTGYGTKTLIGVEDGRGTQYADQLYGDRDANLFYGEIGDDLLVGRGGRDELYGGPGEDRLLGRFGADWLYGYYGADRMIGGRGDDFLAGGLGNDRMFGWGGADTLHSRDPGRPRRDLVVGGGGVDSARVDAGLDVVRSIEIFF
jgi:Ca2+-binding RTX toxin-like protein